MPVVVHIANALGSALTPSSDRIVSEGISKALSEAVRLQLTSTLEISALGKEWTRASRDELRRCVDRASQRVFPPVDTRWYADPSTWEFEQCSSEEGADGTIVARIQFRFSPAMGTSSFSSTGSGSIKPAKISRATRAVIQHVGCEWLSQQAGPKGSPSPPHDDVLQSCRELRLHRTPHVDPRGICLTAVLVAHSDLVAFVALPSADGNTFTIVGRVPTPAALMSNDNNSRKRSREADGLLESFGSLGKVYAGILGRKATVRSVEPKLLIDLICYRVFASHDAGHQVPVIEFDDCYPVEEPTTAWQSGASHTFVDACEMVRTSCSDALKLHREFFEVAPEKSIAAAPAGEAVPTTPLPEDLKDKATIADVARHMLDTTSVRFIKDKKLFRLNEALLKKCHPLGSSGHNVRSLTKGAHVSADECSTVEFKARASDWVAAGTSLASSSSNKERLRHTVCAMTNTFGGYLLLGLSDDGNVLGIDSDASELRTTGLCPALFQGGVDVTKLRVTESASDDSTRKALPAGWWKTTSTAATTNVAPTQVKSQDITAKAAKVVATIVVHSGSAPFYTPSKFATPSMRGAASTLRMPVRVCCQRLAAHLPHRSSDDASGDLLASLRLGVPGKDDDGDAWSS